MSWTDERIDQLKRHAVEKGMTASQIADELGGVSRNAVIGKAHRLGLQSRPSPVKANEAPRRKPVPKKAEPSPTETRVTASPADSPAEVERPLPASSAPGCVRTTGATSPAAHRLDRTGRFHASGTGRPAGAHSPRPAAPPRARKAQPRNRGQNQPARSDREDLQMADGASRRTRLPFLRREGESPAFPIASSIAVAPIRPSCRAAPAARRRHCPSKARASAKAAVSR